MMRRIYSREFGDYGTVVMLSTVRHANGEALPSSGSRVIPCQAKGNAISTLEGVETRTPSSVCSNESHECPAAQVVEDIVRSSGKPESGDKELHEDIARA